MIVISDTSPLNYLIQIDCIHVLPELYGDVTIPRGVVEELQKPGAPQSVREWIVAPPDWLKVIPITIEPDSSLQLLGLGEREAICLAQEISATAVIIDEDRGRKEAKRRGLEIIGTLGVLRDAAERGFIDLPSAIEQLRRTNFRVSDQVIASLLP